MKIFLVTLPPLSHRTSEENLGILYLAASLRDKGYDVCVIDAWLEKYNDNEVFSRLTSEKSLFIGFSSYMTNTLPTINMIKKLKQYDKNINIVCGGFGPTFYPKEHLEGGADIVSIGEGEETLVEIADYYSGKNIELDDIKGIAYFENGQYKRNESRPLLNNLDVLPFPSRDTINTVLSKKSTVNMVTSRGCSGDCEFCSVVSFFRLSNGKVWRTRSIENIVDELEELSKKGVKFVKFVDDSFIDGNRDAEWCKDFATAIKERNINMHFRGQIRADKVSDEILYYLKEAGFFSFACGIENGSDTALQRMNKRSSKIVNQRALNLFKKHGYILQMGYILFDKFTTMDELFENYEFLNNNQFAVTKGIFSEMFSATGTKLNDKLENNGELVNSSFIENNNKYEINDKKVKEVYDILKKWHKSHSYIYDKCIDPLTAPKAISMDEMKEFYNIAMELKKEDLIVFKKVLEKIKNDDEFDIDKQIECSDKFYEITNKKLEKLYHKSGLEYDAKKNPFI